MPDEIQVLPGNAELVGSVEASAESSNALDDLLKAEGGGDENQTPVSDDEKAALEQQKADEKAKADLEAKAKSEADAAAAVNTDDAAAKAKADEAAKAATAAKTDELDSVELPPHVKPKTVESFTKVKELARTKITELSGTVEKLTADLKSANEAIEIAKSGKASKEIEAELEELRSFRRGLDVESDPEFKKFDAQITANEDAIYLRLQKAGFDEASIKRVKEIGVSQVNWTALGEKVPADVRRFLDVKLVENESLADAKEKAIGAAKKNSVEFLKNRQAESSKSESSRKEIASKHFSDLSGQLPWLKEQEITKDTKPADKVKIEAHNARVKEIQADVKEALNDHSPEMHAVLVAGYAKMLKSEADLAQVKASHKAETDKLKATLAEKEKFIADIQKSSTGRLGGSSAPAGGAPKVTTKSSFDEPGDSALDRIRKEVEAEAANRE
jgi:hypothetical protein